MHEKPEEAHQGAVEGRGTAPDSLRTEALRSVALNPRHRVAEFTCSRSQRVTDFLRRDVYQYVAANYARVFVLPNPDDANQVWGFYTLSAASVGRDEITGSDQKRVPRGLPVPMLRIGYMGRDDASPKGLGASLIVDAARRAASTPDVGAFGLILDAEGNAPLLVKWYESVGFRRAKVTEGAMYASFRSLVPEFNQVSELPASVLQIVGAPSQLIKAPASL